MFVLKAAGWNLVPTEFGRSESEEPGLAVIPEHGDGFLYMQRDGSVLFLLKLGSFCAQGRHAWALNFEFCFPLNFLETTVLSPVLLLLVAGIEIIMYRTASCMCFK